MGRRNPKKLTLPNLHLSGSATPLVPHGCTSSPSSGSWLGSVAGVALKLKITLGGRTGVPSWEAASLRLTYSGIPVSKTGKRSGVWGKGELSR